MMMKSILYICVVILIGFQGASFIKEAQQFKVEMPHASFVGVPHHGDEVHGNEIRRIMSKQKFGQINDVDDIDGCSESLLGKYAFPLPSWCNALNPFSTQEQPLFVNNESIWRRHHDQSTPHDPDHLLEPWYWKPLCVESSNNLIGNESCKAVSSFASGRIDSASFVLIGHYTGWLSFLHFTATSQFLHQFNYLGKETIEPAEENAIRWIDVLTPPKQSTSLLLVGTTTRISVFEFNSSFSFFTKIDEVSVDGISEHFVSANLFIDTNPEEQPHGHPPLAVSTPYSMITIHNSITQNAAIHFLPLTISSEERFTWNLLSVGEHLTTSIAQQAIAFKESPYAPSSGTVYRDASLYRNLLLLHNGKEVKLLQLKPNVTDASGEPIHNVDICFGDRNSVSSFFFVRDENTAHIADAQLIGDNLRDFKHDNISCHHVQYSPAQRMLLVIAINSPDSRSFVEMRAIPEMAAYDRTKATESSLDNVLNPATRPFPLHGFPCTNGFFNEDTTSCEHVHTLNYSLRAGVKTKTVESRSIKSFEDTFGSAVVSKSCGYLRDPESCYNAMRTWDPSCEMSNILFEWAQKIHIHNYISVFILTEHEDPRTAKIPNDVLVLTYQWYLEPKTQAFQESLTLQAQHEYVGHVNDLHVTDNGLHSYASVTRSKWQYDSFKRYASICEQLGQDPANVFLQSFKEACSVPLQLDLGFFVRFNSFCYPGKLCTSIDKPVVSDALIDGFFTLFPNLMMPCPDGKMCVRGLAYDCPPGFRCKGVRGQWWLLQWRDLYPLKCYRDDFSNVETPWYSSRTCAQLQTPEIPPLCPSGSICLSSASLPVMIPPSFRIEYTEDERAPVNTSTRAPQIEICESGMWCPLGANEVLPQNASESNTSRLLCPAGTYCISPGVTTPSFCDCNTDQCDYCPAGSVVHKLCPQGYFCPLPTKALACPSGYNCPLGTVQPTICPAGYYCERGVQRICPSNHYCKKGSVSPTACSFLSYCPEGSSRETIPTLSILTVLVTLSFVYAVYFILGSLIPLIRASAVRNKSKDVELSETTSLLTKRIRKTFHISFTNMEVRLRDGRTILHPTSGSIQPARIFCILGGSGAGKTTFMTALRGIIQDAKVLGRVTVNGHASSLAHYASSVSFIPQDDIMPSDLTIRENLFFSSRVKMSITRSTREISGIVNQTLKDLGLEAVQHQIIGDIERRGISGGERKRTSLAMGLVQEPSVLFCDEITSGLDSNSALSLMHCLKRITKRGYTVVVILHQPSVQIFDLMDDILLLGKNGHPLYCGPKDDIVDHFEAHDYEFPANMNPCDHLLDISAGFCCPKNSESTDAMYNILRMARIWRRNSRSTVEDKRSTWRSSFPFSLSAKDDGDMMGSMLSVQQSPMSSNGFLSPSTLNTTDEIAYSPNDVHHGSIDADPAPHNQGNVLSWLKDTFTQRPSFLWQFIMCIVRSFMQQIRDLKGLFLELALIGFSSICLGIVFGNKPYIGSAPRETWEQCPPAVRQMCRAPVQDSIIQVCYLAGLSLYLVGSVTSLKLFGGYEKIVYARESAYLGSLPYFLGKNLASLPGLFFAPALYLMVLRFLIGFQTGFFSYYVFFLITYVVASGIGQCLSLLLPWSISLLSSVILSLTLGFFAGNVPTIPDIRNMLCPVCYAPHVNPLRWTLEALYLLEIKNYESTNDIEWSLEKRDYDFSHLWTAVYVLAGWVVAIRVVAYLLLLCTMPNSLARRLTGRAYWIFVDVRHKVGRVWSSIVLRRGQSSKQQFHEI